MGNYENCHPRVCTHTLQVQSPLLSTQLSIQTDPIAAAGCINAT